MKRRGVLVVTLALLLAMAVGTALWLRDATRPAPESTAATPAPPETGTVKFLMEQQWAGREPTVPTTSAPR
jgi:hypothetical protein